VTVGVSQNGTALPDLTGSIQITVDAVADIPTLNLTGTASGAEDTAIALARHRRGAAGQRRFRDPHAIDLGRARGRCALRGHRPGRRVWALTGLTRRSSMR